jgi:hypothetical protein
VRAGGLAHDPEAGASAPGPSEAECRYPFERCQELDLCTLPGVVSSGAGAAVGYCWRRESVFRVPAGDQRGKFL